VLLRRTAAEGSGRRQDRSPAKLLEMLADGIADGSIPVLE